MKKKNSIKLSAILITLNEEKNLPEALSSVADIADEIVVLIDSRSTDNTVRVAKSFGAKVYIRDFINMSDQKIFASKKASGEWILALDADEQIEDKLRDEIKLAIESKVYNGYLIGRRNIIFGAEINYTRWSPDEHVWLWKKDKGKWTSGVHAEVRVDGKIGRLKGRKVHRHYSKVKEFFEMMINYSNEEAGEYVAKQRKFSYFRLIYDPIYNFLVRYFYRLGFLDGWRGFTLSYLMAIYHLFCLDLV